jgi:hypothetical protein
MQDLNTGSEVFEYRCNSIQGCPQSGPKYDKPCTISDKEISNCTITNGSVKANGSSNGIYIQKEVQISTTQDISKETQHSMYMDFDGIMLLLMLLFVGALQLERDVTKLKSLKLVMRRIQYAMIPPIGTLVFYFILTLLMSVNWDKFF